MKKQELQTELIIDELKELQDKQQNRVTTDFAGFLKISKVLTLLEVKQAK